MSESELFCVNHSRTATLVRCSNCEDPICTRCMKASSVGMKCPECARPPARARHLGRPRHYLLGGAAGLVTGLAISLILAFFSFPLFGFLLPAIAGFAGGTIVMRAAARQKHGGIQALAAASIAAGLISGMLLAGTPAQVALGRPSMFGVLIAAGAAAFAAGR